MALVGDGNTKPIPANADMSRYSGKAVQTGTDIQKKEREKAIVDKGSVHLKKKSGFAEFKHQLFAEEGADLKGYIVNDVLIPTIKSTISDVVSNGIDILLYGEARHGKSRITPSGRGGNYVSYNSISSRNDSHGSRGIIRPGTNSSVGLRSSLQIDSFVFDTRAKAMEILDRLCTIVDDYGIVAVSDLYDLCGEVCPYTYNNYGWRDLRNAGITLVRDGYLLSLPTPQVLD